MYVTVNISILNNTAHWFYCPLILRFFYSANFEIEFRIPFLELWEELKNEDMFN